MEDADRLAAAVSTVAGVSDMVAEYRALFADVRTRLDLARAEVVGDVDSAVQVTLELCVFLRNNYINKYVRNIKITLNIFYLRLTRLNGKRTLPSK